MSNNNSYFTIKRRWCRKKIIASVTNQHRFLSPDADLKTGLWENLWMLKGLEGSCCKTRLKGDHHENNTVTAIQQCDTRLNFTAALQQRRVYQSCFITSSWLVFLPQITLTAFINVCWVQEGHPIKGSNGCSHCTALDDLNNMCLIQYSNGCKHC